MLQKVELESTLRYMLPQLATLHLLRDKLGTNMVIHATQGFTLQCNNVVRQVKEKCCQYYRTLKKHGWLMMVKIDTDSKPTYVTWKVYLNLWRYANLVPLKYFHRSSKKNSKKGSRLYVITYTENTTCQHHLFTSYSICSTKCCRSSCEVKNVCFLMVCWLKLIG